MIPTSAFQYLLPLAIIGRVLAIPAFPQPTENPWQIPRLFPREDDTSDDDVFDPSDLSHITKLAAIGDSYSAGIGAGERLGGILDYFTPQGDYGCSRYDGAYPYLVNEDPRLGDPSKRKFQFKSCSGAVVHDVLSKQIPLVESDQQAILVSIGGNDAELVDVLNQCIYQWGVLSKQQELVAEISSKMKEYGWLENFDLERLGRGCEAQLARSESIIASEEFSSKIDSVLHAAKEKLADDGMIYFTGYGKFFAEDLSLDCEKVSWTVWLYSLINAFQPKEYLTVGKRRWMNSIVDSANEKIKAAVEKAGPQVKFVDWDPYAGKFHGRYCEAGVDETSNESDGRPGLMFYELNMADALGNSPWKRSTGESMNGTFMADLDIFAQIAFMVDSDIEFANQEVDEKPVAAVAVAASSAEIDVDQDSPLSGIIEVPGFLPDGYGRVFHPTILGHNMISNLVIHEMTNTNLQKHGHEEVPRELSVSACAYSPSLPTLPPRTTAEPTTMTFIITPEGNSCAKTGTELRCTVPREPCDVLLTCESWKKTAEPPEPTSAPPEPTSKPEVNPPPSRTICHNQEDCHKWTCAPDGKKASCGYGNSGDPFNSYCQC